MKNRYVLLMLVLTIVGCKRVAVDFTYSPTAPKAGETVVFSNLSSGGENWVWRFGDNGTSTSKNPTHVYRKPGEYSISLMVDSVSSNLCVKTITIFDTVPSFAADTDSISVFKNVTFSSRLYNPFSHDVSYRWLLDDNAVLVGGSLESNTIKVYFTKHDYTAHMHLDIINNGVLTGVDRDFYVYNSPAPSLLIATRDEQYMQRYYGDRMETPEPLINDVQKALLDGVQDTIQAYGDTLFNCATILPGRMVEGFVIDRLARKVYFRDNGLYVASVNGSDIVAIETQPVASVVLDLAYNRLYWSTDDGVWRMPLLQSPYNTFSTNPVLVNSLSNVTKMVLDSEHR